MSTIILSKNKCPMSDAGSIRDHCFCRIIREKKDVLIFSLGNTKFNQEITFEDAKYISMRKPSNSYLVKFLNRFLYLNRVRKYIKKNNIKVDSIIIVGLANAEHLIIKSFCKKNNVKLFFDSNEWYSKSEFRFGGFSHSYIENNILNRLIISKQYNVFSISTYLENHFKQKNIPTIRIPAIIDVENCKFRIKTKLNQKFLYVGTVEKKDRLIEIIEAFCKLPKNCDFEFKIVGITKALFLKRHKDFRKYPNFKKIIFCGKQSIDTVRHELLDSDFSFLFRFSDERYAKAGFPTKVVESLSTGTPLICNISSDLNLYLKDGYNCLLVDEVNSENIKKTIQRAMKIKNIEVMSDNARKTALINFDYRLFVDKVFHFWENN